VLYSIDSARVSTQVKIRLEGYVHEKGISDKSRTFLSKILKGNAVPRIYTYAGERIISKYILKWSDVSAWTAFNPREGSVAGSYEQGKRQQHF
jgi:hypothetical protein